MPIPNNAIERVNNTHQNGAKERASYFVDGHEIGWRYFDENGVLLMEYEMRDGKYHGRHRDWHHNGIVCEEGFYVDGKEHGETKQFDEDGRQIGSYHMDHGTGLDLWYQSPGILAEERAYRDGHRHGFERFWRGDNQTIGSESHFWNGENHGIFREWNSKGKLSRGFPKYFIHNQQVTKQQYIRAAQSDPTLPPFSPADNDPHRPLPPGSSATPSIQP